jgi:nitroreductase
MQNMVIGAWSMGVGSCWEGDFNEQKVKKLLKVPESWSVVALVSFGYPAEKPEPRKESLLRKL